MSDLQNAIDRFDRYEHPPWIEPLIKAARLVANPNKDAVRRFVNGCGIYPFDLSEFVDGVVAAAFTRPGDTDE